MTSSRNAGRTINGVGEFRKAGRVVLCTAFIIVAASCQASRSSGLVCPVSRFRNTKPLVIAHASSTFFGPANTLVMMRAAVAAGADVVDADIRTTSDGVLVASHDDDLRIATDTAGTIHDTTIAHLRSLDAARTWPGPHYDFPLRGRGVTIPTVEEILVSFPHRRISLEFKATGGERNLCALLRRLHRTKDVYVGSAGDAAVDTFQPICPEVATTVTDALVETMNDARAKSLPWCSPSPLGQPPFVIGARKIVTSESVRWEHEHGMAVYTWTLDDAARLNAAAEAGVDGVYTGRADLARAIFDRR